MLAGITRWMNFVSIKAVPKYRKTNNCFGNFHFLGWGSWRGGVLISFPSKLFFSNPNSNPTIPACVTQIEIPFPFFYCFCFMNPSPSAQNPISQPLKKANPSSHFTPSWPSGTSNSLRKKRKRELIVKFCLCFNTWNTVIVNAGSSNYLYHHVQHTILQRKTSPF